MSVLTTAASKSTATGNLFASSRWKFWQRRATPNQQASPPPDKPTVNGKIGTIVASDGEITTRVQFEVKHWVKGRLRIIIPKLAEDEVYRDRLKYEITASNSGFVVHINPKAKSLLVEYEPQGYHGPDVLEQVIICIKNAALPGVVFNEPEPEEQQKESECKINYVKRLGLPGLSAVLVAGTMVGVAVPPLLLGATLIAAAMPSYKRAWEGIRQEKKLNVDFLDSTAITLLTATGAFFPPALMIGLIESGEIIRDMTARRSARAKLDLLDSLGKVARVERDGVEVEIPLKQVQVGDIVVVYPGDQIPVDGVVLSGIGLVDQQKLTGESVPITREAGQDVLAATLVVDGTLRIETRRTGNNTRAGVVVALLESAPVHDTRMEDYARKVGDRIVVPTLALGAATTAMSAGNIVRGVSVITFDVGTGVRVSVPTAILASLTFAARRGILMRSGRGLEQMAGIDAVVFDKTGTLTKGKAGVVGIHTEHDRNNAAEVLQLAATAEQGLTHPVAEAITRHARESGLDLKECEEWEFQVGKGVAAKIDGRKIYVGSHRMMVGLGIDTQHMLDAHPEIVSSAASQVYVAEETGLLGVILYKDPARPESPLVIAKLKEMGITPYMLSGDLQNVATAVAAELGIAPEHVYAEAFPERKVEVVKQLQESGKKIAFVGDGINDSAALAHASASVSFAGATDMARETADVVLMDDDLSSLIMAIKISRHAMLVVNQNAAIVVGPNLGGMLWAALIGLSPTVAVLINNGSAIVAEMNGFRPLMGPPGWQELKAQQEAIAAEAKQARTLGLPATGVDVAGSESTETTRPDGIEAVAPANGSNGSKGNGHNLEPAVLIGDAPVAGALKAKRGKRTHGSNGKHGSKGHNGNGHHLEPAALISDAPVAGALKAKRGKSTNGSNGKNGSNGHNGNGHAHDLMATSDDIPAAAKSGNGSNGHTGNGHAQDLVMTIDGEPIAEEPIKKMRVRRTKAVVSTRTD